MIESISQSINKWLVHAVVSTAQIFADGNFQSVS